MSRHGQYTGKKKIRPKDRTHAAAYIVPSSHRRFCSYRMLQKELEDFDRQNSAKTEKLVDCQAAGSATDLSDQLRKPLKRIRDRCQ